MAVFFVKEILEQVWFASPKINPGFKKISQLIVEILGQYMGFFVFHIFVPGWHHPLLTLEEPFVTVSCDTTWKVYLFAVFQVCIFPHSKWIRRHTKYLSVFSPIVGKCRPKKLRIQTFFHAVWAMYVRTCFLNFFRLSNIFFCRKNSDIKWEKKFKI